jgi:hypothetical protein
MDLSDLAGSSGWLSSLLGGSSPSPGQPTSLAAPGVPTPTADAAGLPVSGPLGAKPPAPGPTVGGALGALSDAAPGLSKNLAAARPQMPAAPQINFPQPRPQNPNAMAQALAQVMTKMKQPQV